MLGGAIDHQKDPLGPRTSPRACRSRSDATRNSRLAENATMFHHAFCSLNAFSHIQFRCTNNLNLWYPIHILTQTIHSVSSVDWLYLECNKETPKSLEELTSFAHGTHGTWTCYPRKELPSTCAAQRRWEWWHMGASGKKSAAVVAWNWRDDRTVWVAAGDVGRQRYHKKMVVSWWFHETINIFTR